MSEDKKENKKITWEMFLDSLKILKKHIKPYKSIFIWLSIFSVVGAVIQAFVPYLAGRIIDQIVSLAQTSEIQTSTFVVIGIWGVVRLGHEVLDWRATFKNDWLGERVFMDYMSTNLGELFRKPVGFHKNKKRGEVWEKISRASRATRGLIRRFSTVIVPAVLTFLVAIFITFTINPLLALVLVVAVIFYSFILWRSIPELAGLQRGVNEEYSEAYGNAHDALENVEEVKYNATEEYEKNKIKDRFIEKAMPVYINMIKIYRRISVSQRVLIVLSQLSIFLISVYLVKDGAITPGELVAFNGYASMMFSPFVQLGRSWERIQNGVIQINESQKIAKKPSEIYEPEENLSFEKIEGRVVFKDVSFSYDKDELVLKNVSIDVQPGERIALVGESGVGKSTFVGLILGINIPTKGRILIDGENLENLNLKNYRSRVGMVSQEPTLFNDTIEFNIKYGSFNKSLDEVKKASRQARAHGFISEFTDGYKQRVGWKGIKLSIGQKQRIALARAFLKDPEILMLDEPTSALDAKSEHLIKNSLEKLMKGRTTFIIAHRLSTIKEADKILVLDEGRLVEEGTHEELLKKKGGVYKKLHDYQIGIYDID